MSRYIDADNIPTLFDEEFKKTRQLILEGETHLDNLAEGFLEADRVIRKIPAADVVEVVHGKWIHDRNNLYGCNNCLHRETMSHKEKKKYCPNCGAKMDGERKEV